MKGKPLFDKQYRKFLKRLKEARLECKLTQTQVAKKLKQPQTWVSKCELAERRVDLIEANRFAKIYGKSLDYFVGNEN